MLKQIAINNFNPLRDVALDELRRVNLFVGDNFCGKSKLLECVYMHICLCNLYVRSVSPEEVRLARVKDKAGFRIWSKDDRGMERTVVVSGAGFCASLDEERFIPVSMFSLHGSLLTLAPASVPGGVVLVDDIDRGIFGPTYGGVWRTMRERANAYNTQVFATTHSFECIYSAWEAFEGSDDLALYRLEYDVEKGVVVVRYSTDTLGVALSMGLEVR